MPQITFKSSRNKEDDRVTVTCKIGDKVYSITRDFTQDALDDLLQYNTEILNRLIPKHSWKRT